MTQGVDRIDNVVVVKVGTNTMLRHEDGREVLDHACFQRICQQVLRLRKRGYNITIVSSGAVTAGMEVAHAAVRPKGDEAMPEMQRLATIGWRRVLNAWDAALGEDVLSGEILITRRELSLDTPEHDEALRTVHALLAHGDIPILNENDAITHGELSHQSFGQNDTLAAIYAAQIAGSELFGDHVRLVLLSDVDGVYEDREDPSTIIREIYDLDQHEHLAGESAGKHGKGGMKTKFDAARIALDAGVEVWVANGQTENAIQLALDGAIGTHFKLSKDT
jgi:glutamate 5-kinase